MPFAITTLCHSLFILYIYHIHASNHHKIGNDDATNKIIEDVRMTDIVSSILDCPTIKHTLTRVFLEERVKIL